MRLFSALTVQQEASKVRKHLPIKAATAPCAPETQRVCLLAGALATPGRFWLAPAQGRVVDRREAAAQVDRARLPLRVQSGQPTRLRGESACWQLLRLKRILHGHREPALRCQLLLQCQLRLLKAARRDLRSRLHTTHMLVMAP